MVSGDANVLACDKHHGVVLVMLCKAPVTSDWGVTLYSLKAGKKLLGYEANSSKIPCVAMDWSLFGVELPF